MGKIEKDIEKLNTIPYVNNGGCGYVAMGLKRKHGGSIVKLATGFFSKLYHIALRMNDNTIVDATGKINESDLNGYTSIEEISDKELKKLIKNKDLWFGGFNRNDITAIEKKLNIDLSDLK